MPHIRFVKNQPGIEVPRGSKLMDALLDAKRPVASSCFGDGICGRCRIQIVQGMENLSPINATEEILRDRLHLPRDVRISCQTLVLGDITIDTTYW